MARERDYAFEALAEVTDADVSGSRGELNVALKSIRAQCEIEDSYMLANEIHEQAARYRVAMGWEILLTPTALAKHWKRVAAVERRPVGSNLRAIGGDDCATCGGNRMVVVATRRPYTSPLLQARGLKPTEDDVEEYAPCPDCNPRARPDFRRHDGTYARSIDPARVREMMNR